jgi:predicted transposase YbfD/YdcC
MMSVSLIETFSTLEDPRIDRKKKHALVDILFLTVSAMISGAEGWEAIEEFGVNKLDWLRKHAEFKNGIPSHDCISYVISRLSPKAFQQCFLDWVHSVSEHTDGEIIAIDGKTARGSKDKKSGKKALHMVSAWATQNRLVLGQEATAEKSNEITVIPKLLELLEIKGCIITIDAMGCQQTITKQIIEQSGDYVIGLKGNQGQLHEATKDFFKTAEEAEFKAAEHDYNETIDKGHGRLEVRQHWITEDLSTLPENKIFSGMKSFGMVRRTCIVGDKETIETRYFCNSIKADAKVFAAAVRDHWGVENSLHWCLDVTFREDESRIRKGNAPTIMTTIRHLSLNILQQEPLKMSIKKKRLKSGWNDEFRSKVLFGGNF